MLQSSNSIDLLIIYIGWMVSEKKNGSNNNENKNNNNSNNKSNLHKKQDVGDDWSACAVSLLP